MPFLSWKGRWAAPAVRVMLSLVLVGALAGLAGCGRPASSTDARDPLASADETGDLFNASGTAIRAGDAYLDIVGTRVYRSGGHFTARIELLGQLPAKVDAGTFIEWDILIDTDRNAATGQSWPLIANDLGYDYLVRVGRDQQGYSQMVYRVATQGVGNINYKASGAAIELYFEPAAIGGAVSFDYVIATRKYVGSAPPDSPSACDKAPTSGHRTVLP